MSEDMKDYLKKYLGGFDSIAGGFEDCLAEEELKNHDFCYIIVYTWEGRIQETMYCRTIEEAKKQIRTLVTGEDYDPDKEEAAVIAVDKIGRQTAVVYDTKTCIKDIEDEDKWDFPLFTMVTASLDPSCGVSEGEVFQITARFRNAEGREFYSLSSVSTGRLYEAEGHQLKEVEVKQVKETK